MKPTELQISDWVLIDSTPRQVVQLTKSKVGYHTEPNECRMHYARYADVEPIPITAEILEKNGFEQDEIVKNIFYRFYDKSNSKHPCEISIGLTNDKRVVMRIHQTWRVAFQCPYIENVHQLQQVIRLCGIDKQIEL